MSLATKKWPKRSDKLILVMMLKNEAQRICQTTLDSIKDYIGHMIIYDTGSTDGTQEILKDYCNKHDIKLSLKEGDFVNFCVSRNVLLDYCDEILIGPHFLLQLDAHDELQNGETLVNFIKNFKGPQTGFYLTQRWFSGNNVDSYYNVRLVISHARWRYKGVVHEYIMTPDVENKIVSSVDALYRLEGIYLYQDRTADNDSSFRRFKRDKELLYAEYLKDPHEPRTLFYLAQTCSCLGLTEESYKYYLLRLKETGFFEENYQSYIRLGDLALILKHSWEECMGWYLKAFQHSQRAEPLVKIAEYYKENNLLGEKKPEWHTCYAFASLACQLIYPSNNILFIDQRVYTYKRHHLLGIAAYYVGKYKEGKEACLKAIEAENKEIDKNNLRFYLEKEIEISEGKPLECPALLAATMGEMEIRHNDEFNIKFDRIEAFKEVMTAIIKDRAQKGNPLSQKILSTIHVNNPAKLNTTAPKDNFPSLGKESKKGGISDTQRKHLQETLQKRKNERNH